MADCAPDSQTHTVSTVEPGSSLSCHSFQVTLERGVFFLYRGKFNVHNAHSQY